METRTNKKKTQCHSERSKEFKYPKKLLPQETPKEIARQPSLKKRLIF